MTRKPLSFDCWWLQWVPRGSVLELNSSCFQTYLLYLVQNVHNDLVADSLSFGGFSGYHVVPIFKKNLRIFQTYLGQNVHSDLVAAELAAGEFIGATRFRTFNINIVFQICFVQNVHNDLVAAELAAGGFSRCYAVPFPSLS
jgi:hypothetical protein